MAQNVIDEATGLVVLEKRSGAARTFDIDARLFMRTGDTIATLTDVAGAARGLVSGSSPITITAKSHDSNQKIQAKYAGGTDLEDYIITATFITAAGESLNPQVLLRVRD